MYTYDVQYADFNWDQVKGMGAIDVAGAIKAFRTFPFKDQFEKAQSLPEGTALTISFRSTSDQAVLAVWLSQPNLYEVYMENDSEKVTIETNDEKYIVEAIKSFFAGSRSELYNQIASHPSAVPKRGFWSWLLSHFK